MKNKVIFSIIITLIFIMAASTVFAAPKPPTTTPGDTGGSSSESTGGGSGGSSGTSSGDLGLGDLDSYKGSNADSPTLVGKANNLLGLIQVVGIVISVVMIMAIGIKYMLGSVEEKAEYKSTLVPYLIGAFILFTGTTLPNIIYQFTKNM